MQRRFKTFLTVIGAVTILVLAANSAVYAATGGKFILGHKNTASKVSTLKRTTGGSALKLVTKSSSDAPLATNAHGKVANLNADMLDGKDSAAFAPYPKLIRGTWALGITAAAPNASALDNITFGWTLPSAPITRLIPLGDPLPVGCSGSASAPNAAPGYLCIFEATTYGTNGFNLGVCNFSNVCPGSERTGAVVYGYSVGAGLSQSAGSWAVRPASVSASRMAPSGSRVTHSGTAIGR